VGDDRPQQIRLVLEVVVQLTLAHRCALDHIVKARPGNAALANQPRGRRDDPRTVARPFAVLGRSIMQEV
jgi:hypothetical protein